MAKGIKVSPKHGVNPTIPVCFWCGNEKNEIALLGKLPGDAEAPRAAILNYQPCDDCKAQMSMGYTLVGTVEDPPRPDLPPISAGHYPTGNWTVVTEQGLRHIFKPEVADQIIAGNQKTIAVEDELVQRLSRIHVELKDGSAVDLGPDDKD